MGSREEFLTSKGRADLQAELDNLRSFGRQDVAQRIQRAKELGGAVDNGEYDEAKNEQAFVEGRILTIEKVLRNSVLIPAKKHASDHVEVGSVVTVKDPLGKSKKYTIVGSAEASPSDGKISNESPVGKALLGCKAGDEAEVNTPSGTVKLNVTKIK